MAQIVDTIHELRHAQRVAGLFADASHWTNEPYVQRGWFRKGKKVKVPGPAKRQSTTLFGALHLSTQKMYWPRAPRGTSKLFIEFLPQLHQRFADALLLLILDNAKIHKSRLVKRFVKQHDWIALEHLEPYSPEYNLRQIKEWHDSLMTEWLTRRIACRPNPIGVTLTRIVALQGAAITVVGLDAINGSPILDLKPYKPIFDAPPVHPLECVPCRSDP